MDADGNGDIDQDEFVMIMHHLSCVNVCLSPPAHDNFDRNLGTPEDDQEGFGPSFVYGADSGIPVRQLIWYLTDDPAFSRLSFLVALFVSQSLGKLYKLAYDILNSLFQLLSSARPI